MVMTKRAAYDAAMDRFRAASAHFRQVSARYRAGEIDDAEYLRERAIYVAADKASDDAERALIEAEGL